MRWTLGCLVTALLGLSSRPALATAGEAESPVQGGNESADSERGPATEGTPEAEATTEVDGAEGTRHKRRRARKAPGPNAVVLSTQAKVPDWGVAIGYQRVLGRRFSVGAALEYGFQPNGYWHLQGVGETLSSQVWLGRPFNGVFAEASLTVLHQFLVQQPRLSTTAIAPGIGMGFRWTHHSGLTLGASGGLRWGRIVDPSDIVCTRAIYCTSVREGAYAKITADVGFVF
ncbi:MAG: hypothetical protein AAF799_03345 [Myxococcota bacterium]